jgi:phosphate/sulfate permease
MQGGFLCLITVTSEATEVVAAERSPPLNMYGLPVSTTHVLSSGIYRSGGGEGIGAAVGDRAQLVWPASVQRAAHTRLLAQSRNAPADRG